MGAKPSRSHWPTVSPRTRCAPHSLARRPTTNGRRARLASGRSAPGPRDTGRHRLSTQDGSGRLFTGYLNKSRRQTFVAVGTPVTRRPPHRSVRAGLLHTALTSDAWRQSARSDADAGCGRWESSGRPDGRNRSQVIGSRWLRRRSARYQQPDHLRRESCSDCPCCRAPRGS